MKRRDFIIGIGAGMMGVMLPFKALASEYEYEEHEFYEHKSINRLQHRNNPTLLEQKHVPLLITRKEVRKGEFFNIKVKVGFMKEHPSTATHWIKKILLLVDGRPVAKMEYPRGVIAPAEASFKIRLDDEATIEAVAHCTLHGVWISEPVQVKII